MIVVMQNGATKEDINSIVDRLEGLGFTIHLSEGIERTIIGAIGDETRLVNVALEVMNGVDRVLPILQPYKLASRTFRPENSIIKVGNLEIGGDTLHVMAGPCAVEGRSQFLEVAHEVKEAGATIIRGGAYKPRTSPYSFQGLEEEGLKILAEAKEVTGLPVVTEVVDPRTVELVAEYADILQIGARNMQNFFLLKEVAKHNRPVMLKRGPSATIEEWLMAAEYIMAGGNYNVILCERGIRTFETYTRNTLDLNAVVAVKQLSHLPVIVDPSHGTGKWKMVQPMARASIGAGADGLMVEVHCNPSEAMSDGPQSLTPANFKQLMQELQGIANIMGKSF